jgi:hypothetical protein
LSTRKVTPFPFPQDSGQIQYLGVGYGVHDFDIHYFYTQNPLKPKLARSGRKLVTTVGSFERIRVDFFRTVIPERLWRPAPREPRQLLACFLTRAPTPNALNLSEKAVVGLLPEALFGVVIWEPGSQRRSRRRAAEQP